MTMNYNFQKDMKAIREILGMTQEEFAEKIGVEQATISRNELGKNLPSPQLMERVYQFAFDKKNTNKSVEEDVMGRKFGIRSQAAFSWCQARDYR